MTSLQRRVKIPGNQWGQRFSRGGNVKKRLFSGLVDDQRGVTAIEYGLIAGLISVAIIAVLLTLGGDLTNVFNQISGALQNGSS